MNRNVLNAFNSKILVLLLALSVSIMSCDPEEDDPETPQTASSYKLQGTTFTVDTLANTVTIKEGTDKAGLGTTVYTMSADTTYILDGFVFVNEGQKLNIEPGTIIKGKQGTGANSSALIVARGGMIMAEGTAAKPIIFTSANDPVKWMNGALTDQTTLNPRLSGQWGGLIVLGKGKLNVANGEQLIEGLPETENRGMYGGTNDGDNSGVLKYVSIRHGGTEIAPDKEINGLSLGGIGNGTKIEYVEVFGNEDDGFEFWGGDATYKYLLAAFNKDDSFDYDAGFRGKCQFWFAVQDTAGGDEIGEFDGGDTPEDGTPYAMPEMYNLTFYGASFDGKAKGSNCMEFKANAGGKLYNSIFMNQKGGISVNIKVAPQNSYARVVDGALVLKNNLFFGVASNTEASIFTLKNGSGADAVSATDLDAAKVNFYAKVATWGNSYAASAASITRQNPVPATTADFGTLAQYPTWATQVNYKGAFEPGGKNWTEGWTLYDAAKKASLIVK